MTSVLLTNEIVDLKVGNRRPESNTIWVTFQQWHVQRQQTVVHTKNQLHKLYIYICYMQRDVERYLFLYWCLYLNIWYGCTRGFQLSTAMRRGLPGNADQKLVQSFTSSYAPSSFNIFRHVKYLYIYIYTAYTQYTIYFHSMWHILKKNTRLHNEASCQRHSARYPLQPRRPTFRPAIVS